MTLRPEFCPITTEVDARQVFVYDLPPPGERGFDTKWDDPYHREVWQFKPTGHYVSVHEMDIDYDYSGLYVDNTYGSAVALHQQFERIRSLPPGKSDNYGRLRHISDYAEVCYGKSCSPSVLDIGSGLGVFPDSVVQLGWECVALDPDPRAAQHINEDLHITAVCSLFKSGLNLGGFDIISFNKVLEHVVDPIGMLRVANEYLNHKGFVYLEVPDGETAELHGSDREEFFLEHHHIFSLESVRVLVKTAGFKVARIERLIEPSSKFTIRALCVVPDE